MRSCCIALGTVSSHLCYSMIKDNVRKRIYVYTHTHTHTHSYMCVVGIQWEIDRTL